MPTVVSAARAPKRNRSRITSGAKLLPGVHEQSVWARIMRDSLDGLVSHCGGEEMISLTRRMVARRAAALEAELIHYEDKFARIRAEGGVPDPAEVSAYATWSNTQKRACEALGWERTARDVTPSLAKYLEGEPA